jgi:hypothetical protein
MQTPSLEEITHAPPQCAQPVNTYVIQIVAKNPAPRVAAGKIELRCLSPPALRIVFRYGGSDPGGCQGRFRK